MRFKKAVGNNLESLKLEDMLVGTCISGASDSPALLQVQDV